MRTDIDIDYDLMTQAMAELGVGTKREALEQGLRDALLLARSYRTLCARGITVRKAIAMLIATRCLVDRIPLLYIDRDFDPFVEHLGLRSALDLPE